MELGFACFASTCSARIGTLCRQRFARVPIRAKCLVLASHQAPTFAWCENRDLLGAKQGRGIRYRNSQARRRVNFYALFAPKVANSACKFVRIQCENRKLRLLRTNRNFKIQIAKQGFVVFPFKLGQPLFSKLTFSSCS